MQSVESPIHRGERYLRPSRLKEALDALAAMPEALVIAGGTDIFPAHVDRKLPSNLLDVSAVAEMRAIEASGSEVRIGGAVRWSEIASASLPPGFSALQVAAQQVGSIQVQNRGTIAGNICNASPAADGVPPLLVLNAVVELASAMGTRRVPLSDFITGYRKTLLQPGEIVTALVVANPEGLVSGFAKLGARRYLVISILMAAALMRLDGHGRIAEMRVAVGSASERALRLPAVEQALLGCVVDEAAESISLEHLKDLAPINDVRATALYRREAARHVIAEAVQSAGRLV